MFSYVIVGTNDLEKSLPFYDTFLKELGSKRLKETPRGAFYGNGKGPMLAVMKPFDGNQATVGNGSMIALNVANPEEINRLHALALTLGAVDEGAPGVRLGTFYCAYFRDLDGNKFNLFCMA